MRHVSMMSNTKPHWKKLKNKEGTYRSIVLSRTRPANRRLGVSYLDQKELATFSQLGRDYSSK